MSIKLVHTEIKRFLNDEEHEVFSITGKWGVGKTFTWTKLLKEARDKNGISSKRYSYVSLYGVNKIDEVRAAITEASQTIEQLGKPISTDVILSDPVGGTDKFMRKALSLVNLVPLKRLQDLAAVLHALNFLNVYDHLVCIDDLERKGAGLAIRDVFGLITYLNEQRNCKVALILNEDELGPEDKKEFKRLFEKTIDSHIMFAPTAAECADVALSDECELHKVMHPNCVELGISNIRVLRKIERLSRKLADKFAPFDRKVLERAVGTIVLLGWSKYGESTPSLSYLKERGRTYRASSDEVSEEEKKWEAILNEYGFHYFSELDEVLFNGIEKGFFDDEKLNSLALKVHRDLNTQKVEEKFHEAWRMYHDSFDNNEEELVAALSSSFKEAVHQISPMNVNGTVSLLKDIDRDEQAEELIKFYVDNREDGVFNREHLFSDDDLSDPAFAQAFDARSDEIVDDRGPTDILKSIATNRGWSRKDVARLAKLTIDDYYTMFKETKGDILASMIRMVLSFGEVGAPESNERKVAKVATEALMKIGRESELNKRRVRKFGVSL